jgi:hypothetical protein
MRAIILSLIFLVAPSLLQAATLSATVDRTRISLEETLTLKVRFNEQVMFGEPDFSALKQDFDILGNHRSNQYRSVNGRAESWTQWTLTLAPKREGKLLIPSFQYDGAFSEAIQLEVGKPTRVSGGQEPVFLEVTLDKKQVFVQEQALLTIRLFTSVDLNGLNSEELKIDNALVKQIAENQYQKTIKGRPYGVVEVNYAIFPQQSGTLEIPSTLWNVSLQQTGYQRDPFFGRGGKRLRLRSEARSLDVKPKPVPTDPWLPASHIELSQQWSQSPDSFQVGEPITRSITIRADGLMTSQLPPLTIPALNGVKYYPDQPQSEEAETANGVVTQKTESYAIVPSQAGRLILPAIELTWWNTETGREETARLPQQTIVVAGGVMSPTVAAPLLPQRETLPAPSGETPTKVTQPIWFYLTLCFAATTLLFAGLWWRQRGKPSHASQATSQGDNGRLRQSEKQAYAVLKNSIKEENPNLIRSRLLDWARAFGAERDLQVRCLSECSALWPELAAPLQQLESSIYSSTPGTFSSKALLQAVGEVRKQPSESAQTETSLAPLYGN